MWSVLLLFEVGIFFFKQKTAYDVRISDWSSVVCSSDLPIFGNDETSRRRVILLACISRRHDATFEGLQGSERLDRGICPISLVMIEHDRISPPLRHGDGDDFVPKLAVAP